MDEPTIWYPMNKQTGSSLTNLIFNNIDMRPIILANNEIYMFGGRRDDYAVPKVHAFDLTQIIQTDGITTINSFTVMDNLPTSKVLPLVDISEVEFAVNDTTSCYIVWGGQGWHINTDWKEFNVDEEGIGLYCNEQLFDWNNDRRRLLNEQDRKKKIIKFPKYDIERLTKISSSEMKRRRLLGSSELVFIRNYDFSNDDIWYEFSSETEYKFDSNKQLRKAEKFYNQLTNSYPDNEPWLNWSTNLADKMLQDSIYKYRSWSNGFGAVQIKNI